MCLNRGPLADRRMPYVNFFLVYCMPIIPRERHVIGKGRLSDSAGSAPKVAAMFAYYSGEQRAAGVVSGFEIWLGGRVLRWVFGPVPKVAAMFA